MRNCEPHHFTECYMNEWLLYTVPVLLMTIGTVGNALNMLILSRQRMRKYPTTVYLLFLAVADMISVWFSMLATFIDKVFHVNFRLNSVYCKVGTWIAAGFAQFSIWLLVLMTAERMILTISPIAARHKLNRTNAVIASLVALAVCFTISGQFLFGLEVQTVTVNVTRGNQSFSTSYTNCMPSTVEFLQFYRSGWRILTLILMTVVPCMIIISGNVTILVALLLQKRRLRKVNTTGSNSFVTYNKRKSSIKTLFLVCAVFIITNMPYNIRSLVVQSSPQSTDPHDQARATLYTTITILLIYCNFTFNFGMYFLSGTMFKQEFRRLVTDVKIKLGKLLDTSKLEPQRTNISRVARLESTYNASELY